MSTGVGELLLVLLLAAGVMGPEPYRAIGGMLVRSSAPMGMWLMTGSSDASAVSGPVSIQPPSP